ncbi:MAG: HAMP domain-containing sensor histidine kinase [Candidatus Saccharibacteria bacterium]|nr:HAMP domain-containing sensor histidine kinase [Candidatus Saccharibacteria bacterium]
MADKWSDEYAALPSVLVAAHELKAPLALVRQLSLLLEDGELSAAEAQALQRQVRLTAERALRTVTDLSQTAQLTPSLFPLEPVNPLAVCRQLMQEMAPMMALYQRRISWPSGSMRRSRLVVANQVLLGRVMMNFLDNALRYTEESAAIEVRVASRGQAMRLSVRDFGPMMSRQEYRRLLDTLEQRKTVRTRPESSGLGVYIAAQFARAMGGRIGLIRHRDGLTFYIDMPLSEQLSLL